MCNFGEEDQVENTLRIFQLSVTHKQTSFNPVTAFKA